jgi:hypothetical protein
VSNSVSHCQCFECLGPAQGENPTHPDLIAARSGCSELGQQFARLRAIIFGNTRVGGASSGQRQRGGNRRDPSRPRTGRDRGSVDALQRLADRGIGGRSAGRLPLDASPGYTAHQQGYDTQFRLARSSHDHRTTVYTRSGSQGPARRSACQREIRATGSPDCSL